ncbi:CvpA family protein [Candidatus Fermentibacteria bacterium]|nr:CvpA family protein [Candidatus Fermentibacteria bacterium]
MGTLDAVLIVIAAVAAVIGAVKGLVRQVGIVVAVVAGIGLSLRYGTAVTGWLGRWIGSAQVRGVLGPALVFLAVYLVVILCASLLHRLLCAASLGWMNRLAGAALGVMTSVLLIGAILLVLTAHVPSFRPAVARSPVAIEIMRGAQGMVSLVPHEVREAFSHGWDEVQKLIARYRKLPPPPVV